MSNLKSFIGFSMALAALEAQNRHFELGNRNVVPITLLPKERKENTFLWEGPYGIRVRSLTKKKAIKLIEKEIEAKGLTKPSKIKPVQVD